MTEPRTAATPAVVDERPMATAEADVIVLWRDERIGFGSLPGRIARAPERAERDGLLEQYAAALEALNARHESRLAGRSLEPSPATLGLDPSALVKDLERFVLHTETPYFAALRRYLALIGIEQGDATIGDLWHIARGEAWSAWFGRRDAERAVAATGREPADPGDLSGWLAAEQMLRGGAADTPGAAAVGAAWASVVGAPAWVEGELGMAADEVVPFVDFAAFVRLWRLREALGLLQYELRLAETTDPALARVYYSGIVGHLTGVLVPEEMYLIALDGAAPFASARFVIVELLGACLVEVLENRHGPAWWREPASAELIAAVGSAASVEDALARLGYDALDWRPVLRQLRTRLIGEMSGYGGPNITTRAGTRKV